VALVHRVGREELRHQGAQELRGRWREQLLGYGDPLDEARDRSTEVLEALEDLLLFFHLEIHPVGTLGPLRDVPQLVLGVDVDDGRDDHVVAGPAELHVRLGCCLQVDGVDLRGVVAVGGLVTVRLLVA